MSTEDKDSETVGRLVTGLAPRRAPASLEARVLAELQRRSARPWWKRGSVHWPPAARYAFIAICSVLVGLAFIDGSWVSAAVDALPWGHAAVAEFRSLGALSAWLHESLPPAWAYGIGAAGTLLYGALFALSAAVYRSLYRPPNQV